MAIYHLHISSYQRSRGRTAVGGAAYRRGLKAACRVSGKHFNFRSKGEVVFSEFVPAQNDATDYSQLSNLLNLYEAIESTEKHPRATLGREIEGALPHELNLNQQVELVRSFIAEVRHRFSAEQAFFDFSIHAEPNNVHAHICMSEREQLAPFVFAKTKRRDWDGESFVSACREIWQTQTNSALERAGITQRVDCRSHADRGLKVLPSLHEGKAAYFDSEVKKMNDIIKKKNEELEAERQARKERVSKLLHSTNPIQAEIPCSMECADTPKPYPSLLLEKHYQTIFSFGSALTYINLKHPGRATLHFNDRSKVLDYGNRVESIGSDAGTAADRLIQLAIAKGWSGISFNGNEAFLRAAFALALERGLNIVPKDAAQQQMLDELRAGTPPASASAMPAPTEATPPKFAPHFMPRRLTGALLDEKRKKSGNDAPAPSKNKRHGI